MIANQEAAVAATSNLSDRYAKAQEKTRAEMDREIQTLRSREDFIEEYSYFLTLLREGTSPQKLQERTGRQAIPMLCVQVPLELIHAAGFAPFKLYSGSFQAASGVVAGIPALMCPMLSSLFGMLMMDESACELPWVLPTTCDWIVKFPEMIRLKSREPRIHWVELPHLKETSRGERVWLEEVYRLKAFLEETGKTKISRNSLAASIQVYNLAWEALCALEERRNQGHIPFLWYLTIANAFFYDAPEAWTAQVWQVLQALATAPMPEATRRVFVAGSPIFFPGFKIPHLLEEAGLVVTGDDLCSSARIFPGNANPKGSVDDCIASLAEQYHHGCLCPTFADNDRRVNNILAASENFEGVIYQILKGCHPCDIESYSLERPIKAKDLRYLRLETDYTPEDSRNLLNRLEAFSQTLVPGTRGGLY